MHNHSDSTDSGINIRRNPLNIRNSDGSDFLVVHPDRSLDYNDLTKRAEEITNSVGDRSTGLKPKVPLLQDLSNEILKDKTKGSLKSSNGSTTSSSNSSSGSSSSNTTPEQNHGLETLNIPSLTEPEEHEMKQVQSKFQYLNLDLSSSSSDFSSLLSSFPAKPSSGAGLTRKNTITSTTSGVEAAPSNSPQLFERLRNARRKISGELDAAKPYSPNLDSLSATSSHISETSSNVYDSHIVQQLSTIPSPVLNAISYSPNYRQNATIESIGPVVSEPSAAHETMDSAEAFPESQDNSDNGSIYDQSDNEILYDCEQEGITDDTQEGIEDPVVGEDPDDRGRLFVKVQGLKDLRLPIVKHRHPHFSLTLDNGVQTVVTKPINMSSPDAPINQEFELIVGRDLQFILTLTGSMDPMEEMVETPPSPSKKPAKRFPGLFGGHKKKVIEEKKIRPPKQKDAWDNKLGSKGEFARCYVVESQYEKEVYGRPQTFIMSCFNEWEYAQVDPQEGIHNDSASGSGEILEQNEARNSKSKAMSVSKKSPLPKLIKVRKEPYRICGIQITMMYVPRVKMDEAMPVSLNDCLRKIKQTLLFRQVHSQGFMSQQGGDCAYWRRRWFELKGSSLIGYHESSRKMRNVINLANVKRIIEVSNATEDDLLEYFGSIYEERSFRMVFIDGEVVNFYADTVDSKNEWIHALTVATTYCTGKINSWVDLILRHQDEEDQRVKVVDHRKGPAFIEQCN